MRNLTRAFPTSLYNTSGETSSPGRVCLSKGTSSQHESRRRVVNETYDAETDETEMRRSKRLETFGRDVQTVAGH